METLILLDHHRNQCYSKVMAYKPAQHGSPPSVHFRQINCRNFQSGSAGILPTPHSPTCAYPVQKGSPKAAPFSLKTPPSQATKTKVLRSSPIPINIPSKMTDFDYELGFPSENSPFSELWAGPAYSNSPPPSSLPIPNFSMMPKRTVSLDLPVSDTDIKVHVHPVAKSAPASPTRECNSSTRELFRGVDSATLTLRRILNLDLGDDEL